MRFKAVLLVLVLRLGAESAFAQTVQDRLKMLEAEIQRLQQEVENLKRETDVSHTAGKDTAPEVPAEARNSQFSNQILVPDLGGDEREHRFEGRPEIFLQNRFSRGTCAQLIRESVN